VACAHLTVPLDPTGVAPGQLTLAIRRHRAPVGEARTAVVALAGGPGQPAIPFTETFAEILGPALATRDLIVFDQRGTGYSHPLSCHGFEQPGAYRSSAGLIASCARQIGSERAFYTTPDTVADIEALREAGGYEKLVLWGTSYGTKVAEEYAQRYPQHVEALVLDSVVPPTGPEPLARSTFEAVPRILRQLCAARGCAHITANPVGDLARLVRRMGAGALAARLIDGHGHPHTLHVFSDELLGILLDGDFDPFLRAEFPAAARAAADGDTAPLARLLAHTASGGEEEAEEGEGGIDVPLYFSTVCEEIAFPWSRAASPRERLAQMAAQIRALPTGAFAPFTPANALGYSDARPCASWPFASFAPPSVPSAMPDLPTLILSGADDLRTPTANARAVAAQIPDAHLLVVPNAGHAVLASTRSRCARTALRALLAGTAGGAGGHPLEPCPAEPPPPYMRPTPLAPARLADVPPTHGYHGRAGRTLHAVQLTIADFTRQLLLSLAAAGNSAASTGLGTLTEGIGGLRAGWAQLVHGGLRFHRFSYVPGVTLSGAVTVRGVDLRVGGSAAARGTLRLARTGRALVGTLGRQRVHLGPAATEGDAIVRANAGASLVLGLRGPAARAAARRLALALSRLAWPGT